MSRNPEGRIYIRSETTDWNFSLRPAKGVVGLAVVPEEERFEAAVWVRQLLLRRIQTLMLQSQHMRYPCPPDAPTEFQPDGSNLPIAIARLCETQPKQFERWLDHVRMVFPDIQDIVVKERDEDRYRYIEAHFEGGVRVPSWLLSDGTLRFLALTLIAYLPEENRVYLIEEPENGIHPRALEAVYQSLSSVYHSQILCATHSPLLLNMAEPHHLLCFSHQDGATTIIRGDQHPFLKDWKKEVSLGNLLASGVLG
jgi:predicted ATPase